MERRAATSRILDDARGTASVRSCYPTPLDDVVIGYLIRISIYRVDRCISSSTRSLRIKQFYGTSENAVKTQIWVAVSVYVLVAIIKKRLNLDASLYTLLQILSVSIFEKIQLQQAFAGSGNISNQDIFSNQLNLFSF